MSSRGVHGRSYGVPILRDDLEPGFVRPRPTAGCTSSVEDSFGRVSRSSYVILSAFGASFDRLISERAEVL